MSYQMIDEDRNNKLNILNLLIIFKLCLMKEKQQYIQCPTDLNEKEISLFSYDAEQKLRQIGLANFISDQNDQFEEWSQPKKKKHDKRRIRTASSDVRSQKQYSYIRKQIIPSKISPIINQEADFFSKAILNGKQISFRKRQNSKKSYSTFVYNFKCNQKQRIHSSQSNYHSLDQFKPLYPSHEQLFRSTAPCNNFKTKNQNVKSDNAKNINSQKITGYSIYQLSLKSQHKINNFFMGKKIRLQSYSKDRHKETMKILNNHEQFIKNHVYSNICHLKGSNIKIQRKQILRYSNQHHLIHP